MSDQLKMAAEDLGQCQADNVALTIALKEMKDDRDAWRKAAEIMMADPTVDGRFLVPA